MRRVLLLCVCSMAGLGLVESTADAAIRLYDPDHEPLPIQDLRLNVGLFSAVGFLGATYDIAPVSFAELELGTGFGWSGLQLSVMPKLILGPASAHLVAGVGLSMGFYRENVEGDPDLLVSKWLNIDLGYEAWSPGGYSLMVGGGITRGLSGCQRWPCNSVEELAKADTAAPPERIDGVTGLQVRVAFGRWF